MADDIAQLLRSFNDFSEPQDGLGDNPFKLACTLDGPASPVEVSSAWSSGQPPDVLLELWSVSRESRLFEDVDYGQWGLVLLSPAGCFCRTVDLSERRPKDFRAGDVVIGEFLGDSELLILAVSENGGSAVLVALPLDERADWYAAADSLEEFLVRYRVALGAKYWENSLA